MTLEELYDQVGGNYAEALRRLQNEQMLGMFIVKFADDPSCEKLFTAWRADDEEAAFEAAHAAKGVCLNLALSALAEPAAEITEALRPGHEELRARTDVDALVEQLRSRHAAALAAIAAYANA